MEIEKNYNGTKKEMLNLFENNEFLSIKSYSIQETVSGKTNIYTYTINVRFPEELERRIRMTRTLSGLLKLEKEFSKQWYLTRK